MLSKSSSLSSRLNGKLPPTAPLPAALQTLGCRWWPFAYLEWCQARLGHRFTVYPIDMPPLVFLSEPEDIRAVLTGSPTVLHPGAGAAVIAPLIGERSFMLCEEEEHMSGRRATIPAFNRKVVQEQHARIADMVERQVATWPLGAAVALHPYLRTLTLDVILKTIFGDQEPLLKPLHGYLMEMLAVTASFVLQEPQLQHIPGWRSTWRGFVGQRAAADQIIFKLISDRRCSEDRGADLLGTLLSAHNADGSPMSDRQVHDHLMSMILAGHETTTAELAWALQLLAHNPSVQQRLIDELDAGTEAAYLTATVHETLRHRPAFLFTIPRAVTEPVELGGYSYHPPAHLLGCTYLMHHDPRWYRDPQSFRPERFLDEPRAPGTWMPWGTGHKRCIGRHFALLEVETVLRIVLRNRRVQPASPQIEHPRWRSAILVPHAGSRVVLRARKQVDPGGGASRSRVAQQPALSGGMRRGSAGCDHLDEG